MGRTKGTYTLTSNIEPKVGAPLDARTIVKLLADLTASNTFEYPYKGMKVFVEENNKSYTLVGSDPTVSTNWVEDNSGGHTIKNSAGTAMTQRSNLQFIDLTVSDDSINDVTKVENIHVIQSESELANLPDGLYMLDDDEGTVIDGSNVGYDNTTSELNAEDVQDAIDEVVGALNNKVDKIQGKVLSTNDYTNSDKNIVSSISNNLINRLSTDALTGRTEDTNHASVPYESGVCIYVKDIGRLYRTTTSINIGDTFIENENVIPIDIEVLLLEKLGVENITNIIEPIDIASRAYNMYDRFFIEFTGEWCKALRNISINEHLIPGENYTVITVEDVIDSIEDGLSQMSTSLAGKANKSEMSVTPGTGTSADKTTIQLKSGTSATVLTAHQDISGKADKVSGATNGNLAGLNASGNLTDSGWNGAKGTTSISGNPISISGLKSDQLAKNPVITYNPIQDLHGQSKPYPNGGSPTNLLAATPYGGDLYNRNVGTDLKITTHLPNYSFNNARTVVNVEITTAWRGRLFATDKLTAGTYYVAGARLTGTDPRCTIYVTDADLNVVSVVDNWQVAGGQPAQQITVTANQRIAISVASTGVETISLQDFFVGAGSGSGYVYSPFENICPISGYDKIEVLSCGVNVWDETWEVGAINGSTGEPVSFSNRIRSKNFNRCIGGASYYGYIGFNVALRIAWYDIAHNFIEAPTTTGGIVTAPANACYFKVTTEGTTYGESYRNDIGLNYPATQTSYVASNKTTDISESLGQTVYGGTLDVRTGKFTVTHKAVDMGNIEWSYYQSSDFFYASSTSMSDVASGVSSSNSWCEIYPIVPEAQQGYPNAWWNSTQLRIYYTGYTDATTFKNAMTGYKLVYPISNPFTIQLTPHEISLLKDYAYVSTNGTTIALDYHNGEMASLADVSQLGETVNALGDNLSNRLKVKALNYLYSGATAVGTVYTVNNAKSVVFGLGDEDSFGGFSIFYVVGNQNVCYNMTPTFNASNNTFSFLPTAGNSGAVRFMGIVFYTKK